MNAITCRRDELDPEFCATHEDGMFDVEEQECDVAGGYDTLAPLFAEMKNRRTS